ncbi:MAG: cytochrome b [Pseudomonadota bacterium]
MDSKRYSLIARLLHWTVAVLVLIQIGLGFGADLSDRPMSARLLDQHVRFGLLIAALMVLRLSWRLASPPPSIEVSGWRKRTAKLTHGALYLLLLVLPFSGYVLWAWTGPSLDWWGIARVPILFRGSENELWRSVAGYGHQYGAYVVSALVVLHIAAALHHQFVLRDGLIGKRMGFKALNGGGRDDHAAK